MLTATLLTGALAASMAPMSNAAVGTGGSNGGTGAGEGRYISVINFDDSLATTPVQGWGESSIAYFVKEFRDKIAEKGFTSLDGNWKGAGWSRAQVDAACSAAIDEAIADEPGATKARVVSLAISWRKSPTNGSAIVSGQTRSTYRSDVIALWDSSDFANYNAAEKEKLRAAHLGQIDDMSASSVRVTCVAVNDFNEPEDEGYSLKITTDRADTFSLSGGTGAVYDKIHANRGDSTVSESVDGSVVLHWDGVAGSPKASHTKPVKIANTGTTNSPSFTPSDFGWSVWPAGRFWFDIRIPKQGSMKARVNTPNRDPRETWSAKFNLDITTDRSDGFTLAGSTVPVTDVVHANSNGSRVDDYVDADVILNWDGFGTNAAPRSVTKDLLVKLDGDTRSNGFTPADFGWAAWPAGRFWFDVRVPVQGRMNSAVDTPDRDPRETWEASPPPPAKVLTSGSPADELRDNEVLASGQSYNAVISATASGYSSMQIIDTIHTDQVFIGSATADDNNAPYVLAPDGSRVSGATISINRATAGRVVVGATFSGISNAFQGRDYRLVVPTYVLPTGADYTIADDSRVCYAPGVSGIENCLNGNSKGTRKVTPAPDKVWVLDEAGALVTADPGHTNWQGVDQKTFAPGSAISAVVNGRVPANLAENLTQYSITDDWSGAAQYVDFSDVSRVKVFAGGTDVTSQFTVTVSGSTTTATAQAAFLNGTKGLSADRPVKLVLSGQFRNDYDTRGERVRLSNAGSERWNNETRPTNTPPVFTTTPTPDKAWVLDTNGALVTGDPEWTNTVGADGKTFLPGDSVSAVVNGSVPANLGRALDSYSIVDDWSGAGQYVDFSDASKAKVFYNGTDVTGQFTVTVSGTRTTATANAAFLAGTANLPADGVVKLVISGTFRTDYDTKGEMVTLTNAGSETWNNRTQPTNEPPVFTVTPNPDKVWVLDEEGALSISDPDRTNNEGVDNKTFAPGSAISAVVNGSIPRNLATDMTSYVLVDDWTGAATYVDFSDASKAKVFVNGQDATDQFDIQVVGTTTVATAKAAFLVGTAGHAAETGIKLVISGEFRNDYDTSGKLEKLTNAGSESWNNHGKETNVPALFTTTPDPDKVWVLDADGALVAGDPEWSNTVGVDGKTFLMNDEVYAVVNGRIPANLGRALDGYSIVDDWSDGMEYVDFSDVSRVQVYFGGQRVTDEFDISIAQGVTTATAKKAFLDRTEGLSADTPVKLVIGGQFRDDYDTEGELVQLLNKGSETWNNRTQPTNEPPVFTWTPDPDKFVLGSGEESGDNTGADINSMSVWPGQKLEYSIGVDLRIPGNTARGVKSLAVVDNYDPYFTPDLTTVEFWDGREERGRPTVIPAKNYKLTQDEANHSFTVTFTQEWIDANVNNADGSANSEWLTKGWLTMRFTGQVNDDIAGGDTVENQAFQVINGASTATEIPVVEIPVIEPDKEDLNTDLVDIDGKTVVAGDVILYRLTLDGGPARSELAYNVHKLGMVDDFDDEYLDLSVEGIKVTEKDTGADVTDKFNVQIINGVAYVFAKQVDSVNFKGQTISGEPQPEDLAVYSTARIDPHTTPIIDQSLLGKDYYVTLTTKVVKELDGYVIENQATQNIQNTWHQTKIVSNPLKDIDPVKDVVVSEEVKDDSIDGTEVALDGVFNYRLNSSEIPANRAYKASQWSITDTFNPVYDQYVGIWAAYANEAIYDGDTLIYAKGDLLQDSAGHETEPGSAMFDVTFDQESYTFKIDATRKFLDLVNTRTDLSQSFSVYTKMIRIAPSERVENQATEFYNDYERKTNVVWTSTPEHPAITVEKYTLSEGVKDGDRDDVRLAYEMTPEQLAMQGEGDAAVQTGVKVGITVTNTGDVKLVDVALTDKTHQGAWGDVDDLLCVAPEGTALEDQVLVEGSEVAWVEMTKITELKVGQSVDCVGVLRGMGPGMTHGDTFTATGKSVFTGKTVIDEDPWFAKAPSKVGIDVEKYTLEEGAIDGDRDVFKNALVLTPEQAENGLKIGIDVTNTGDEPLADLKLEDVTHEATTGGVTDIKWWTAVDAEAKKAIIDRYKADKAAAEAAPKGDPVVVEDGAQPKAATEVKIEGAAAPSLDEAVPPVADAPKVAKPVLREPVFITRGEAEYQVRELAELTVLAPSEKVLLVGTLTGVEPGTAHGDTFTASGKGVYSSDEVTGSDPWFAKLASPEVPDPKCPVCEEPVPEPEPEDPPKIVTTGDGFAQGDMRLVALGLMLALLALGGAGAYAVRLRTAEDEAEAAAVAVEAEDES